MNASSSLHLVVVLKNSNGSENSDETDDDDETNNASTDQAIDDGQQQQKQSTNVLSDSSSPTNEDTEEETAAEAAVTVSSAPPPTTTPESRKYLLPTSPCCRLESFAAYFLDDRAIFGAYPTNERLCYLVREHGINVVVNLTTPTERWCEPYDVPTDVTIVRYPIAERSTPSNEVSFCKLVVDIAAMLKADKRVYIHCKGGHGRSGLVAASVFGYVGGMDAYSSMRETSRAHNSRTDIREYYRKIGAPRTIAQRAFVVEMLRPFELMHSTPIRALLTNYAEKEEEDGQKQTDAPLDDCEIPTIASMLPACDRMPLMSQLLETRLGLINATTSACLAADADRLMAMREAAFAASTTR